MRYDDSTVNNPGQALEAFVHLVTIEYPLGRLFHQSLAVAKKSDAPTIHVLSGLLGKNGQIVLGRVIIASREGKDVTHGSPRQC
jgi:methanogenic corrinoid protein MtbC1